MTRTDTSAQPENPNTASAIDRGAADPERTVTRGLDRLRAGGFLVRSLGAGRWAATVDGAEARWVCITASRKSDGRICRILVRQARVARWATRWEGRARVIRRVTAGGARVAKREWVS
jgi:hypothetical protein